MAGGCGSVKVLNMWVSMFGMRPVIALKAKGIPYEYLEQDLANKSPLLLQSNPVHKKIPVLLHNDKPICESLVILEYIDEAWPDAAPRLLPSDPHDRALARFWADYIDKKMYDAGSRIVRSPKGEQREQAKKDLVECLVTLDGAYKELSGGGPFFGGQSLGFVDVAFAPYICWFEAYEALGDFKLPDEKQCPSLCAWKKRIVEQSSVKESFELAPSHKVVDFAFFIRKRFLGTTD